MFLFSHNSNCTKFVNTEGSWRQYFTEFIIQSLPLNPLFLPSTKLRSIQNSYCLLLELENIFVIFSFSPTNKHKQPQSIPTIEMRNFGLMLCASFLNTVFLRNFPNINPLVQEWKHQVHPGLEIHKKWIHSAIMLCFVVNPSDKSQPNNKT